MRNRKSGLTLIEVLVSISVVAILVAIVVPAVLSARAAAQKAQCANNLRNIGIGINNYTNNTREFPARYNGHSAFSRILPYLDQLSLHNSLNFESFGAELTRNSANFTAHSAELSTFLCPSDRLSSSAGRLSFTYLGHCNYAGNVGYGFGRDGEADNGPFTRRGWTPDVRPAMVRDGLSQTVAVSEYLRIHGGLGRVPGRSVFLVSFSEFNTYRSFASYCRDLNPRTAPLRDTARGKCWGFDGLEDTLYNHDMTPNFRSCSESFTSYGFWSAASNHPGQVNALFLDGHVQAIGDSITPVTWHAMGTMKSGETPSRVRHVAQIQLHPHHPETMPKCLSETSCFRAHTPRLKLDAAL